MRRVVAAAAVLALTACSGSSDGELVLFARIGTASADSRPSPGAVELTDAAGLDRLDLGAPGSLDGAASLPEQADDVRRFAFVLAGCVETSARLEVADGVAEAVLEGDDDVACESQEFFLAVFDVPRSEVPDGVVLR